MLSPRDRQTLLASLRPPHGFRVEAVVATTFTLDLTALLTAPLAFSLLDIAAEQPRPAGASEPALDPYALLRSVREHAQRMVVFCDATHIAAPAKYRPLFTYLEKCVVEVLAPNDHGVFHPKLWVLKFVNEADEVSYRVLCSSRNLTFDASWDTLLVLNGTLTDRKNAIAANRPLSDFISQLPGLARPGAIVSRAAAKFVAEVADELLRVKFENPADVTELAFHPLGIEGYTRFRGPERIQRSLVVSPFADAEGLRLWSQEGSGHVVVSRVDQLDAVSTEALSPFKGQFILTETAEAPADDDLEAAALDECSNTGLHAKLFVVDDGWNAHVWTGSANATKAGFTRNVEFLVQMTGKKSVLGVDVFLERGIGALLKPYTRELVPGNAAQQQLELRLCRLRRQLADATWTARVQSEANTGFQLVLHCVDGKWDAANEIRVRPITLTPQHEQALSGAHGLVADFGTVSGEALTPFFAFRVTLRADAELLEAEMVLQAKLEGAPANREEEVMAAMLDDPSKVMRFLSLLLADDALDWAAADERQKAANSAGVGANPFSGALLERLLRALHTRPAQLDSIEEVMQGLLKTDGGQTLVPAQLLEIWRPIYAARQAVAGGAR